MTRQLLALIGRDLTLALRKGSGAWQAMVFFVLVVALFPLAVGVEPQGLAPLAPAILWVAALLASLIGLPGLYERDAEDGTLEQLLLLPLAREAMVLAKTLSHWLTHGLPLVVLTPLLALLLRTTPEQGWHIMWSLLPGTLIFTAIGSVGAALTAGHRKGALLLSLLVMPLYIPALVFGLGTAAHETQAGTLLLATAGAAIPLSVYLSAVLLRWAEE